MTQKIIVSLLLFAPQMAHAEVNIVASLPDLAAIAREVGGDSANVVTLSAPNQDPHYVDPRPSLMLPLSRADMLIVNGLQLEEGWLPPLMQNARNPKIQMGTSGYLDASLVVKRLQVVRVDRSMGDVHPGGNPHFTFDPRAARAIARAVADRLISIDAGSAEVYKRNLKLFQGALDQLAASEAKRFMKLPTERRKVVVYHQSMVYLLDWLQLQQVATVEPLPGIQPNPGHVAKVLKTMRETGAKLILQEDFYQRGPSRTLASLAKGKLVVIPGGTDFKAGERYIDHIKKITGALYEAL